MANIYIRYKDGKREEFLHTGRAGGSYTKRLRYEPGFVVITDEWDQETSIPADLIERIEMSPRQE